MDLVERRPDGRPRFKPLFRNAVWRQKRSRRLVIWWAAATVLVVAVTLGVAGYSPLFFLRDLIVGLFAWTLIEYVLHRYAMHWRPESWAMAWRFRERLLPHDDHHDRPDERQVAIINHVEEPMAITAAAGLVICLWEPWPTAMTLALGGGLGYVGYELVHFATHRCRLDSRLGKFWARHHLFHHYRDETVNFGVTTPLWDWVFGTLYRPARRSKKNSASSASK